MKSDTKIISFEIICDLKVHIIYQKQASSVYICI